MPNTQRILTYNEEDSQLIKNKYLQKDNNQKDYNLQNDLNDYVYYFNQMKHSPWNESNNIFRIIKKFGIKKLGKCQKRIIDYLNINFFSKNRAFYAKHDFLSKQLGIDRRRISKALNVMCSKGLILKVDHKIHRMKNNRVVYLPSARFIAKNNTNIKGTVDSAGIDAELSDCALLRRKYVKLKSCSLLLRKLLEYKDFPNAIGILKANNIISYKVSTTYLRVFQTQKDLEGTSMRHKLMIKGSLESELANTLAKTKLDNFRILLPRDIKILSKSIAKKYSLDLKHLFKFADKANTPYGGKQNRIRQQLIELLEAGIPIDYVSTDKAIKYFNSVDHPRFQKTTIKKNSQSYLYTAISVTHCMHFICKNDYLSLKDGINNLKGFGLRSSIFVFLNKWSLLDFVSDHKNKGYLDSFCNGDGAVAFKVNQKVSRYPDAMQKWQEIFIEQYSNQEKGAKDFRKYESKLTTFLDALIDITIFENRYMSEMKLTVPTRVNGMLRAPLLKEYLVFLLDSFGSGFLVNDVVESTNWENFVQQRIRNEFGYKNFWVKLDKLSKSE